MNAEMADRALKLAGKLVVRNAEPDVRVTIRIHPDIHDRLKAMQEATGVASINDVVKNALFFYDAAIQEKQAGNDVMVCSPDGESIKLPVFI